MTKPNRELDAKAAEVVMGWGVWKFFHVSYGCSGWGWSNVGRPWQEGDAEPHVDRWRPTIAIRASMMLVDKLCPPVQGELTADKPLGRAFRLTRSHHSGRWRGYFSASDHAGGRRYVMPECGQVEADTRELAMTLAAIQAAERKEHDSQV